MATAANATCHRARPRWRRWLRNFILAYLGVLILLLALERTFIYHPVTAAECWVEPPDPRIQDVFLTLPTGERIHAWWLPIPDATGAILYAHGNAGNLSQRGRGVVRWATELNSSVLIFDYPGYGRSTGRADERSCYAAAESAWDWLTHEQKIAPEQMLLLGASLGGAMAVELAQHHDCRAAVLIKAFSSIPDMAQQMFPWLPSRYLVRHRYDNCAKLPNLRRPVFVVHGTGDRVIPFSHSERLFAAANEPKEFLRLEGDDHNASLPDGFFERLRRFLAAHAAD
jgi:dipeptidyl aminopeptidase/acylaminoacyl peptidase